MLNKPIAVVLLLAAIIIAAFVGGYVAQQVRVPVSAENPAPGVGATPVPLPGEASSGGTGGAAGGSAASGGGTGSRPTAGRPNREPSPPPSVTSSGSIPSGAGVPTAVPGGTSPIGVGTPPVPKEVSVPAGTIIGIELSSPLSSATAKVEDPVEAAILGDVPVGSQIAIPAGTRVLGSVMLVEKGGGIKAPSRLGVRLHTLVPTIGPEVPLSIEPLIHQVDATPEKSAKTIGIGAAVGAGLGWILGGTDGAIKGGAAGAGGGTAAAMMAKAKPAELPKGAQARVRLMAAITVTVAK